jgi:hypothetical protein
MSKAEKSFACVEYVDCIEKCFISIWKRWGLGIESYTLAHVPLLLDDQDKPASNPSPGVYCNDMESPCRH